MRILHPGPKIDYITSVGQFWLAYLCRLLGALSSKLLLSMSAICHLNWARLMQMRAEALRVLLSGNSQQLATTPLGT